MVLDDPLAGRLGRLAGQVLAGGVAGRVVEAGKEHPARRVLLDVVKPPGAGGGLRRALDLAEVLVQPASEVARFARALEEEGWGPLHAVVDDCRDHAAGLVDQAHSAVVARHQRALRGRERHVELAARVLAVDEERAGEADRDLRHADERLDVARQHRGVERVARHVLERRARTLLGEQGPCPGRVVRVVVLAVARNGDALAHQDAALLNSAAVSISPPSATIDAPDT